MFSASIWLGSLPVCPFSIAKVFDLCQELNGHLFTTHHSYAISGYTNKHSAANRALPRAVGTKATPQANRETRQISGTLSTGSIRLQTPSRHCPRCRWNHAWPCHTSCVYACVCARVGVIQERERERERARARAREGEREREREAELGERKRKRDSLVIIKNYSNRSFFDGYCSTVHWFEVDLGFTKLVFFRLICELSVFSSHEIHE